MIGINQGRHKLHPYRVRQSIGIHSFEVFDETCIRGGEQRKARTGTARRRQARGQMVRDGGVLAVDHPESRYAMTGYIELGLGNARVPVCAFINERKRSDSQAGGPFISLSTRTTDLSTGEIGYAQVALGNVVNTRSDGGEVFYDTVIFNPVDADGKNIPHSTPLSVWVTDACDAALHRALGCRQARV